MAVFLTIAGLGIAAAPLAEILWSIARPAQSIWPPIRYTAFTPLFVWAPTFALFGILIGLGVLNWGELPFPRWLRFGLGLPLIVLGNIVVWSVVAGFGVHKTGGAPDGLQTDGLYRVSRNPQYVADIVMILGWMILAAAPSVTLVGLASITVLIAAPFSEEPWLRSRYGREYEDYAARVRRFF